MKPNAEIFGEDITLSIFDLEMKPNAEIIGEVENLFLLIFAHDDAVNFNTLDCNPPFLGTNITENVLRGVQK